MDEESRDHGLQPLDQWMGRWGLANHDLVEASTEQLSHKQVQKGRKGRQLTLHLILKVTRAFNAAVLARIPKERQPEFHPYLHRQLFNYAKGHDPSWTDPNAALAPEA
jgi:hypothetical protein